MPGWIPSLQKLLASGMAVDLKPEQFFHDGRELTSADVVATYRSVLDRATVSPHRASLENIVSLEASSTFVVDFKLRKADPLFPGLLVIGILPADQLAQANGSLDSLIGSGPFAVVD